MVNKIWQKIIGALNKSGVDYVLVGGAAMIIHGMPRSTLDIDIFVPAKTAALKSILKIENLPGFSCSQESIKEMSDRPELFANQWICFTYKGSDVLDVYFAPEKEFARLLKNSIVKKDGKSSVRVASLDDITLLKRASNRPIDHADLILIRESKKLQNPRS